MMKKWIKYSVVATTMATLAACSSGGGSKGSDEAPVNASDNKPMDKPVMSGTTDKSFGGVYYGGKEYSLPNANKHPKVLEIAGREFEIQQDGIITPGFQKIGENTVFNGKRLTPGVYSGSKFDVRFGYIALGNHSAVYYQGNNPTSADMMPKGQATYVGDAVYVNAGKAMTQMGTVNLMADFDNKQVSGTLFAQQGDIAAVTVKEAMLDGNMFKGKAVQNGQEAALDGKFYGKNADEVAGAYSDGKGNAGWQGAFGAEKQ